MRKQLLACFVALISAVGSPLSAQNFIITAQTPDQLVVCAADTLRITIQNKTATPASGALLDIELPAGLEYLPGSVSGATESNIGNLEKPVLALPVLNPNAPVTLLVQLSAGCGLVDAINSGQLFDLLLRVRAGAQNEQVNTAAFQIQTSLLVITQVDNDSVSGVKDEVLIRTLHVQNTRLGAVKHLFLRDNHPVGISIHAPGAVVEQDAPTAFQARFDGAFFTTFGDGDTLLEFGETALIRQEIRILDCGVPQFTCRSDIAAEWSCTPDQAPCQGDSTYADVVILPSALQPRLVFQSKYGLPWDVCGDVPIEMQVRVVNAGPGAATNILLKVYSEIGSYFIDKNSFRLRRKNDIQPVPVLLSEDEYLPSCDDSLSVSVTLSIPELAGFDTVDLIFNTANCAFPCFTKLPLMRLSYFYNKPCPAGSFLAADTFRIRPGPNTAFDAFVTYAVGDCLKDGETYPYSYFIQSGRLLSDTGYVWLKLDLPHGVEWSPDCIPQAGGKTPDFFAIDSIFEKYPAHRVAMAFKLPLSTSSAKVDFCLKNTCRSDASYIKTGDPSPGAGDDFLIFKPTDPPCTNCAYDITTAALLTLTLDQPFDCAYSACDSFRLRTLCVCTDTIDPDPDTSKCRILREYNRAARLNYDLPDNDDNRIADPGGTLDLQKVRRDRFLPGDTLRSIMSTKVVCGDSINDLFYRIYLEIIASDYGYGGAEDTFNIGPNQIDAARFIFTNKDFVNVTQATIAIWDSSANAVYTCPVSWAVQNEKLYGRVVDVNVKPENFTDEITSMNFSMRPDMTNLGALGCVPPGFLLETGDSVALTVDIKLGVNYIPISKQHYPPLINFEAGYARGGTFYNYRQHDTLMFQYSGFFDSLTNNTFGIRPCENSVQVSPFSYTTRIARANLFPFEVRPLAKIAGYALAMPQGLAPFTAEMMFLTLQDNVSLWQNTPIPFGVTDEVLRLDFSPFYLSPPDEGYALRTRVTFAPNCDFTEPDSSILLVALDFPGCMNMPDTVTYLFENKLGFFANHPRDTMTTDELTLYFPTPNVLADVFIENKAPVAAPNYWVQLVNPEGGLAGLTVTVLGSGTMPTPVNGIYQVGALPLLGQKKLRISGQNSTCDPQRLLVIYGWGCQPHTQPDGPACGRDTLELLFLPQNPELELQLVQMPAQAPLCDSSDYVIFEIFNADLGNAYNPFASVELPPGYQLVPGSCQIAYPVGGVFSSIPDPSFLGGNVYEWNLAAIQAALGANGLSGVDLAPQNALRIRFRLYAGCGVVSNTQLVFGARAEWSCGKSTNILRKASDPLSVNGVIPGGAVQISMSEPGGGSGTAPCASERTLRVNLVLSSPATTGDSIYITLPQGYDYVDGSYLPGNNAPAGPPQVSGSTLRLSLPPGLPVNTVVAFELKLLTPAQPNCTDVVVQAQTRSQTAVFCPAINDFCTVYTATGEASYSFKATDPDIAIHSVDISTGADGFTDLLITAANNSPFALPNLLIHLYHDLDGDGQFSAADTLLLAVPAAGPVPAGGTVVVSMDHVFPALAVCRLLVVLPAAENCDCGEVVYPVSNDNITYSVQQLCVGQNAPVGIPGTPGHSYLWTGAPGLPCDTCSQFVFMPAASGLYQLTLSETGGECPVDHHFTVQADAPPVLLSADTAVCAGQPVSLQTSPAVSWSWTGPGGLNVSDPVLIVAASETGVYQVVATTLAGCTLSASVTITVLPADTLDLGTRRTCEGTAVDVFGALTDQPGVYRQTLSNAAGCDSTLVLTLEVLPEVSTEENRERCPADTIEVFGQAVSAAGTYCETYTSSLGCDSIHCVVVTDLPAPDLPDPDTFYVEPGGSVQLPSPGDFATYFWAPGDYLDCTTCPSPVSTPADTIDYVVRVSTGEGCTDTLVYRVVLNPPCDPARIKIPNAFTPNGDKDNDVFTIVPYEGTAVIERLTIYNRWGQRIYTGSGPAAGWDGTADGKPAPADVYVWILEVRCAGEEKGVRHGDVTLLR